MKGEQKAFQLDGQMAPTMAEWLAKSTAVMKGVQLEHLLVWYSAYQLEYHWATQMGDCWVCSLASCWAGHLAVRSEFPLDQRLDKPLALLMAL